MTTHKLAKLLLSKEDTILKLGYFSHYCGEHSWEEIKNIEVVFQLSSTIIQEKL